MAEYPVELNGKSVHIDFVLGFQSHLLVAECKRVEGWRWAFVRGHSELRGLTAGQPRLDYLRWVRDPERGGQEELGRDTRNMSWYSKPFDLAVELKPKESAEQNDPKTPKAFDDALTQVLRARGGLIEDLCAQGKMKYSGGAIVPVIITTAPLFVTETELHQAHLQTGHLKDISTSAVHFLWFDHSLTASLRPKIRSVRRIDAGTDKNRSASRVPRLRPYPLYRDRQLQWHHKVPECPCVVLGFGQFGNLMRGL